MRAVSGGVSIRRNNVLPMVPKPRTADEWRLVAVAACDETCTLPKDLRALVLQLKSCRLFSPFVLCGRRHRRRRTLCTPAQPEAAFILRRGREGGWGVGTTSVLPTLARQRDS